MRTPADGEILRTTFSYDKEKLTCTFSPQENPNNLSYVRIKVLQAPFSVESGISFLQLRNRCGQIEVLSREKMQFAEGEVKPPEKKEEKK